MKYFQFSGFFQMMALSVMNLFPLYWQSLGYSDSSIGILNGVGMVAAVLGPFFFGWVGSHKPPTKVVAACFLLSGLCIPLMLASGNIVVQTLLVGLSQFLKVGFLTLVPVGVLHLLGPRAGLEYGRYRRSGSAGFFVAGAAGLLIQATTTSASVWIFAVACLLAAIPFLGKVEIPLVRATEEGWGSLLRDRRTFYFLLGSMLLSTWNAGVWIYLPLRMCEMSATPNLISWTMAECGLIAIISLTWTGRLADRLKNPALLLLVVPIAAAVRLALMALPVENPYWFLLIQWMHVPVWVLGEVASIQFVRHYTKVSLFPRVQAVLQVGTFLGMGGASVLMGLVVRDMGIRDTILLSSLLPLTALPVLWLSFRAKQAESAN